MELKSNNQLYTECKKDLEKIWEDLANSNAYLTKNKYDGKAIADHEKLVNTLRELEQTQWDLEDLLDICTQP